MNLLADLNLDPRLADPQVLTIAAGIVAGLGVVGALHYLIRERPPLVPPSKGPKKQDVLDPFEQGLATEQRKSLRRDGNPVEVLIVNPANDATPAKGFVLDRCVGGLGLFAEGPAEVEKPLSVRPTHAPSITPWVEVIVKSCRQSDGGYEIGCQFVRTPPWSILLMFG
jgi:hypothetical protein